MRKPAGFAILTFVSVLVACGKGGQVSRDPVEAPPPTATTGDVAGDITRSTRWSGNVHLIGTATVKPGITLDVDAGVRLSAVRDAVLVVEGTLNVNGTSGQNVVLVPDAATTGWGGIRVASGGRVTVRYADATAGNVTSGIFLDCQAGAGLCQLESSHVHAWRQIVRFAATGTVRKSVLEDMDNGGVGIVAGGNLTLTDSIVRSSETDLIVLDGGSLHVEYSQLGDTSTYEHCGLHTNASASLRIDHTVFKEDVYGMMLGNSAGSLINHNNFLGNQVDIENMGGLSAIDITQNYFGGRPANISGSGGPFRQDATPLGAAFADAGPRP